MSYTEDIQKAVWNKARKVKGLDPAMFRLDACGALIIWGRYSMVNPYGWEIDHIFPKSLGGRDDIDNLRALHYKNNRSKGNDYPSYIACVRYNGTDNVEDIRSLTVNKIVRDILKRLYPDA